MKRYSLFLILLSVVFGFMACQRDDSEPTFGEQRISRLYVSTSDYGDETNRIANVYIIDPADSSVFPELVPEGTPFSYEKGSIRAFISGAKGGRFINYTPFKGGWVFQGSQNLPGRIDTAVHIMTVNRFGALTNNSQQLASRRFNNVKGIDYTVDVEGTFVADYLFLLNGNTQVADTMYMLTNIDRFARPLRPRHYTRLDYNSFGIKVAGRDVFVSSYKSEQRPNSINGVIVYKDLVSKLLANVPDTLLTNLNEVKLSIAGANNIRGINYSKSRDLLLVTDYSGTGDDQQGRIFVFENFSTKNKSTGTITPDRTITSTGKLKQPLDVAIDDRPEGRFIYVADAGAKRVFRFKIDDKGNVEPNQELNLQGRTPQSLSLDAR